jgi:hypothetical protein
LKQALGLFYLTPRTFWIWGVYGMLVSVVLFGTVLVAAVKRRRWLVLLAHVMVLAYWFVGSVLIAAGE